MRFIWDYTPLGNIIVSLVVMALVFGCTLYVLLKIVKRVIPLVIFGISTSLIVLSYLFDVNVVLYLGVSVMTVVVIVALFANLGDLRKFLANPFSITRGKSTSSFKIEKIFDREAMYKQIEAAVINLSKSKIGAIITFEKSASLKDIIKNGVAIKAPVTAELLETIFYPGTRLHDGAVVIAGNEVVAASVFFTPTTKAFAGKYGSRHRAAIGISEITDSVTVVVSEETGRISFAVNGSLESVDQANFLRVLENLLNDTNK